MSDKQSHHLVRVRAAFAAAVTLSATNRAPDGKPQTRLCRFAGMRAIFAGAGIVCPGWVVYHLPFIGGFPTTPLWKGAVDGVPRLWVDEATVRRGCDDKA